MSYSSDFAPWPKIFLGLETPEDRAATARTPLEGRMAVVGDALMAWGLCSMSEGPIPSTFGDGMAAVDKFLNIGPVLPNDLSKYADVLITQHKLESGG